jgi:hypothetical protein
MPYIIRAQFNWELNVYINLFNHFFIIYSTH